MRVCAVDGVPIGESRSGALVHLNELPKGTDPYHHVVDSTDDDFLTAEEARAELKGAVEEMIAHHATFHPLADCEWSAKLVALMELS